MDEGAFLDANCSCIDSDGPLTIGRIKEEIVPHSMPSIVSDKKKIVSLLIPPPPPRLKILLFHWLRICSYVCLGGSNYF